MHTGNLLHALAISQRLQLYSARASARAQFTRSSEPNDSPASRVTHLTSTALHSDLGEKKLLQPAISNSALNQGFNRGSAKLTARRSTDINSEEVWLMFVI